MKARTDEASRLRETRHCTDDTFREALPDVFTALYVLMARSQLTDVDDTVREALPDVFTALYVLMARSQ